MGSAGDLVLMGPPGSGKGTQAQLLAKANGWVHLSTGDLFRDHIKRETELGRLAKGYLDKGHYVPDEVTVGMVRARLAEIGGGTRVVFDGFPRTVAQAEALDELLAERGRHVGSVVLLVVPKADVTKRLSARGRTDDAPDVAAKRLEVYEEQTRPVLDHYRAKGLVHHVDGEGEIEAIGVRLLRAAGPD